MVKIQGTNFYLPVVYILKSVNPNISTSRVVIKPKDELMMIFYMISLRSIQNFGNDERVRRLLPREGDTTFEGRFGQSIRFGSNIIPKPWG